MKKSTRTILISVVAAIVVIVGGFGAFHWYQAVSYTHLTLPTNSLV